LLESILKSYGHEVTSAGNGAEALELARLDRPDLIITDIFMPVMDGFTLCSKWKADEFLKTIPIIFYTATYVEPKDEQFALSLGVDRFLVKPQKPKVLVEVVRQVLDQAHEGAVEKPSADERETLRLYSETLLRKLEQKVAQLENEITERKTVQEQLRAAADDWQSTFDSIQDLVIILDSGFQILCVNAAAISFFNLPQERIIGNRCHALMHGTDFSPAVCPSTKAFQSRRHEEVEIFHEAKDAWLLASADPILDADGEVARIVHADEEASDSEAQMFPQTGIFQVLPSLTNDYSLP